MAAIINPRKVAIVGCGFVGSASAFALMQSGLFSEMVLIDVDHDRAEGEALDIAHGMAFGSPMNIYAGDYSDIDDAAITVITAGANQAPGETRLDLVNKNVAIFKSIIPQIVKHAPNAVYIIVANPVDILTYVFTKVSGLPEKQVIGSGTILDTARLRARIAEYYNINQQNVHAYVFGEHGDTSFVPWSMATVSNIAIDKYSQSLTNTDFVEPKLVHSEVETYIRKSGGKIIERKGATFYAVAVSVCHICKCVFSGADTAMTVSSMMHGEYGIDDVCLSTLSLVGPDGLASKVIAPLTEEETALLHKSADSLKSVIAGIKL